jgi:hypothetical protein
LSNVIYDLLAFFETQFFWDLFFVHDVKV